MGHGLRRKRCGVLAWALWVIVCMCVRVCMCVYGWFCGGLRRKRGTLHCWLWAKTRPQTCLRLCVCVCVRWRVWGGGVAP